MEMNYYEVPHENSYKYKLPVKVLYGDDADKWYKDHDATIDDRGEVL